MTTGWQSVQLRRVLLRIEQGWSPECESRSAEPHEWGVLKSGCTAGGTFAREHNKALPAAKMPVLEYGVKEGDLLLTRASGSLDVIGSAAIVRGEPGRLMLSDKVFRLVPDSRRVMASFLARVLAANPVRDQIRQSVSGADGLANNLPQSAIRSFQIPLPPLSEQKRIVAFLDRRTAAIDELIAKKERLVGLLAEKRQALITQAVTKGLDPSVPMKDSGVEWIGKIPAHWDLPRTRQVARLESGHTPSRQHPEYWIPEECTLPWISLADVWKIRDGLAEYIDDTAEKISARGLANSAARRLPANTVILSRTASVGFSAIMQREMATTQDFVNWVCGPSLVPEYLLYFLRAMTPEFDRLTQGSVHRTIYMPDVARFVTTLPPVAEQRAIIANIRRGLHRLDGVVRRVREQVAKLREYRQALITAAVTGQVDVTKELA